MCVVTLDEVMVCLLGPHPICAEVSILEVSMFFEPIPKGPSQFPDVPLLTICFGVFVPVDYPDFVNNGVLIFGHY